MMKKITTLFGILALLSFTGCIEDGDFDVTPAPETGFALITPTITNINLNFALPDNPAFTLSWTDSPSGSGPYTVEASTEEDFSAPMTLGSSEGRTFTMSTAEFNSVVIGAGAEAFEPFMIHMRVSKGADTSETTTYSVSPYTETPPVIASPESGTAVVLSDLDPAATAITMEFEDPDFGDSNGMTVDYTLEFAAVGTDFETVFESETTNELSLALSNEALNTIALEAGLIPEEAANLEVRLKA
ncbi:MAG: SusE domain-containing protein, partial [Bacteroidota bacterium]